MSSSSTPINQTRTREARYLSPGELDQIKSLSAAVNVVSEWLRVLSESRERIVKQAGGALFQKRPD